MGGAIFRGWLSPGIFTHLFEFTQKGVKNKIYPESGSTMGWKTLLMREVREEKPEC